MNGFAELSGEANPLTPALVYSALQNAGSNQQLLIQSGTRQLQQWETQRGFYSLLQAVYLDKTLPTEVRYLAVIQLKNGIDKYFRKTSPNAISPEERHGIRVKLLDSGINEADPRLAKQNAMVISKVIRVDWPTEWPEALNELIAKLRVAAETNSLHLRRGLLVLLSVVKDLSTARLRNKQTLLQSVTPEIVYLLSAIYIQNIQKWTGFLNGNCGDQGESLEAMESSLYCLKILRRLFISGYEHPHQDRDVQQLWAQWQQHFGLFLDLITRQPPILVVPALQATEKHLFQLAKLHLFMSENHPASFALLPDSVALTRAYWGLIEKFGESYSSASVYLDEDGLESRMNMRGEAPAMEKLALKGLNILRACLKMVFKPAPTFKHRTPEIKEEQGRGIKHLKTELLTDAFVLQMANVIVTKFFVFRRVDLEAWDEAPDEWEAREDSSWAWQFEIRPCCEGLFMDLVLNFKHLLQNPLLAFFGSVAGESDVVNKDSVYTAMGLSAAVVYPDFDFDSFLVNTLVKDVQLVGPGYKVLRRRVAILIAKWIPIKIDKSNSPLVYQIFKHLLDSSDQTNDQVVRITAARQFQAVVDDFGFETESFLPFASDILLSFMSLLREVENTETKMAILTTLRAVASRMERHVSPYADQIVTLLPELWEASGEEHLMKQAILTLLSTIVTAMRQDAMRYNYLILPLIHRAVEPGSDMQVYLMEEALDLWTTILDQTPKPASPEMIALLDCVYPLLEVGSETLPTVLNIIKHYVLLCPEVLLAEPSRLRLMSYMRDYSGNNRRYLAGSVTTIVERMVLAAENLGGVDGIAAIGSTIVECGLVGKILDGLRDAWECHQTTGPNRKYAKLDDVVETDHFIILARFALCDPRTFFTMIQAARAKHGETVEQTWDWLSNEWFQQLDSMVNIDRQKLSCLALTRLLGVSPLPPWLLTRLQDYFAMWTTIIDQMQEGREDGGDNLIWLPAETDKFETQSDIRARKLAEEDLVHTVNTLQYVKEKLQHVAVECGGEMEFRQRWAVDIDRDVLNGFAKTTGISLL